MASPNVTAERTPSDNRIPEIIAWASKLLHGQKFDLTQEERDYIVCLERRQRHLRKRVANSSYPVNLNLDKLEADALQWVLGFVLDVCSEETDDNVF